MQAAVTVFLVLLVVAVIVGGGWLIYQDVKAKREDAEAARLKAEADKLSAEADLMNASASAARAEGERELAKAQGEALKAPSEAAARAVDRQSSILMFWGLLTPAALVIIAVILSLGAGAIGALVVIGMVRLRLAGRLDELLQRSMAVEE